MKNQTLKPECKDCWDKGYTTELIGGYHASADFVGEKSHNTGMKELKNFCHCIKGRKMAKEFNNKK